MNHSMKKNISGKIRCKCAPQYKQQGVALVMALIMLLVVTVLGVSSVRMSNLDTQISGNSIYSSMVFQGAESALGKVISDTDWTNISLAANNRGVVKNVPASYFSPAETVTAGATLDSTATITFDGVTDIPAFNGIANSSEFSYQVFRISAQSSLATTSATDIHTEGRAAQIPKQ